MILRGLKLGDNGGMNAVKLLEHWTGKQLSQPDDKPGTALAAWQKWFAETLPRFPRSQIARRIGREQMDHDELFTVLNGPEGAQGNAEAGAEVFAKASCIKCHRYGPRTATASGPI